MFEAIISLSHIFVKLAEELGTVPSLLSKDPDVPPQLDIELLDTKSRSVLYREKFNYDAFSKLSNLKDVIGYADKTLYPVSSEGRMGSSRKVYDYSNNKVLKVAANHSGIAQNNMEARISNRNPLFAKVYDMHPRALWIIAEKIWPFRNEEEFSKQTNIPVAILSSNWAEEILKRPTKENINELTNFFELTPDAVSILLNISEILKLGAIGGDTLAPEHWGLNLNGDLKLLDFGMDSTMFKTFYTEEGFLRNN